MSLLLSTGHCDLHTIMWDKTNTETGGQRSLAREACPGQAAGQGKADHKAAWTEKLQHLVRPEAGAGSRRGTQTQEADWHGGLGIVTAWVTCPSGGTHRVAAANSRAVQKGDKDRRKPGTRIPRASHRTILPPNTEQSASTPGTPGSHMPAEFRSQRTQERTTRTVSGPHRTSRKTAAPGRLQELPESYNHSEPISPM